MERGEEWAWASAQRGPEPRVLFLSLGVSSSARSGGRSSLPVPRAVGLESHPSASAMCTESAFLRCVRVFLHVWFCGCLRTLLHTRERRCFLDREVKTWLSVAIHQPWIVIKGFHVSGL